MNDMQTSLRVIEHEIDDHKKLFDRLEQSIEKLTELSNAIGKILVLHDSRLGQQEEITKQLLSLIEDRRRETEARLMSLENLIERRIEKISEIIIKLDRWKYFVVGGAAIIGFILAKTPILNNLLAG